MTVTNSEIADAFDELADLLEIEGANPFRIRAYRNAAETIRWHPKSFAALVAEDVDLTRLPSIGTALARKIRVLVETGRLPALEQVKRRTPAALGVMMKIRGLGPRRIRELHERLEVRSVSDLERAARRGRIRMLPGFGAKTEAMILEQIADLQTSEQRFDRQRAQEAADALVGYLRDAPGVKRVTVAGSYRRLKETVGDLDILVTAARGAGVMDHFVCHDEVAEVLSKGTTRSTVRLRSGLQVDLRVVPQASYGAALYYFTGSKAHNIAVRTRAVKRGLKINEYGVYKNDKRIAGRTESEVLRTVGLPYIPPELRENRGEIEAASRGRLPQLVTLDDIRGDLHCHTLDSDGHDGIRQMAEAAREHGYEYLAITDHSRRVTIAHGLDSRRLSAQIDEIDRINELLDGIVVLKSCEVDILENGKLDIPDRLLSRLDLTVGSVHYRFNLSQRRQTERILRAMDNKYFSILAHPTGRLINERPGYEVNLEQIIQGAAERGCALEVNAQPKRLDLTDEACLMAVELGVKIAISSDAHSTHGLDLMRFGVDQARRGWLTPRHVLNTRPLARLRAMLAR